MHVSYGKNDLYRQQGNTLFSVETEKELKFNVRKGLAYYITWSNFLIQLNSRKNKEIVLIILSDNAITAGVKIIMRYFTNFSNNWYIF